ncbi:hypothetical protein VHUM_03516 [Vanrija humicola]|uniref:Mediator of RNA polymerase II transcription subunit 17 n=1 Tax=Vanrija humicola TaxID=5417 RepID=A0A7D8YXF1_VANHU|nr:hypothetical protein VHUM_03516 [Vanrija humicola]
MEPNGDAASPFADVRLAVDAYTLDTAAGKRRLKQIEHDGSLTYDEVKPPRVKRTEHLERIWNEYPAGLLDLTVDGLRAADPTTTYGDEQADKEETEAAAHESGKLMSVEDMEALRTEVFSNLNDARNELWFILELAKTLAASADIPANPPPEPIPAAPAPKKAKGKGLSLVPSAASSVPPPATSAEGEPPILPAGTYTATPGAAPVRSAAARAHALELALAAKQRALDDCGALIDAAVDELRVMADASARFTSDIVRLKSGADGGQWAVVPRPNFGGRSSADEMAKDVVVPYALDEAPPPLRARSLAAFDLDPRKVDGLSFGARSYLRLRVLLRSPADGAQTTSRPYAATAEDTTDVCAAIQAAQTETVDEDLFSEIRNEVSRLDGATIEPQNISLRVGKEELTFQLYDTRETPAELPQSPMCDLLLGAARMGLMHTYRRRKQRLIDPSNSPPSSILLPIVHVLQYNAVCRAVLPALNAFHNTLSAAGLTSALVERSSSTDSADGVLGLLSAKAKVDVLGTVFTLEVVGCQGVTVNITAPAQIHLATPRATFALRDVEHLGRIVADTLTAQLQAFAFASMRATATAATGDEDSRVWFDELDGSVVAGALGPLSIEFGAAALRAWVDAEDAPAPYDSSEAAQPLTEWLADLARAIPHGDEA